MSHAALQTFSHYPAIPPSVRIGLRVLPEHPCNYLAHREAQSRAFYASDLSADAYQELMDAGFRRSGCVVYQPICRGCRACIPIRVRAADFSPSRSQRRSVKLNCDVSMTLGAPVADDESFELYRKYLREWHGKRDPRNAPDGEDDRADFESFLYDSPVHTIEFRYRDPAGRLLAVGLCDVCSRSISSVYFYFDPAEQRRSLGTFGAVVELNYARENRVPYYYLGYWVEQCAAMNYKSAFRPFELLCSDGEWRAGAQNS